MRSQINIYLFTFKPKHLPQKLKHFDNSWKKDVRVGSKWDKSGFFFNISYQYILAQWANSDIPELKDKMIKSKEEMSVLTVRLRTKLMDPSLSSPWRPLRLCHSSTVSPLITLGGIFTWHHAILSSIVNDLCRFNNVTLV